MLCRSSRLRADISSHRWPQRVQPVGLSRGRPVCLQADEGETPCCRAVAGVGRSRLCGESEGRRSERRRNGRNPALISRALWTGSQPSEIRGSIETVARSRLAAECRPRAPMKARRLARATPWHTSRRHAPNGPHFDRVFRGRRRSGTSKGAGPEPAAVGSMSGTCRKSDADIVLSARFRTGSPGLPQDPWTPILILSGSRGRLECLGADVPE